MQPSASTAASARPALPTRGPRDAWPQRARFRQGFDREVLLTPNSVERYDIDLWFTSRVFGPGHRLRVSVSSALFPKYDRNLNTGGNNERDSTFVVARQRLVHDAAHPSHVVLPVIPR